MQSADEIPVTPFPRAHPVLKPKCPTARPSGWEADARQLCGEQTPTSSDSGAAPSLAHGARHQLRRGRETSSAEKGAGSQQAPDGAKSAGCLRVAPPAPEHRVLGLSPNKRRKTAHAPSVSATPPSESWSCTPYTLSTVVEGWLKARADFRLEVAECEATTLPQSGRSLFVESLTKVSAVGKEGSEPSFCSNGCPRPTQNLATMQSLPRALECYPSLTPVIKAHRASKTPPILHLPFKDFLGRQYSLMVHANCLGRIPPIL